MSALVIVVSPAPSTVLAHYRYSIKIPSTKDNISTQNFRNKASYFQVLEGSVWPQAPIEILGRKRLQILVASLCL